jgi:hypothetical protein
MKKLKKIVGNIMTVLNKNVLKEKKSEEKMKTSYKF